MFTTRRRNFLLNLQAMPKLSELIEKRLQDLIDNRPIVPSVHPNALDLALRGRAYSWCVSATSLIDAVVPLGHPYKLATMAQTIRLNGDIAGPSSVLLGLLHGIKTDFEAGLLSNLEAQVSAQTFDDLLDHAEEYLRQRRKEPAGVLTGVVFEDTIRKLCRRHNTFEVGVKLDLLLSELVKKGILLPIDRNDSTTAASLRTSATHARWEEFGEENVKSVLAFTRRLIQEKLAA
jgi:hypothetical protein